MEKIQSNIILYLLLIEIIYLNQNFENIIIPIITVFLGLLLYYFQKDNDKFSKIYLEDIKCLSECQFMYSFKLIQIDEIIIKNQAFYIYKIICNNGKQFLFTSKSIYKNGKYIYDNKQNEILITNSYD